MVSNPVKQKLNLQITSDKEAQITVIIMSSAGQELQRTNMKVLRGTETKSVNVSPLSNGNYFCG
jgi:hypothetical protein